MEVWQLKQMQSLPLEVKIQKSLLRIKEWYEYYQGNVYVSFSGGKDSTVLLHLVRSIYPDVIAVFCDTGLEFPEIKEFIKNTDNVEILKPSMDFRNIIHNYGYPVATKEQAHYIHQLRNKPTEILKRKLLQGIDKKGNVTKFKLSKCWYPLLDAPFKVSNICCDIMKKRPAKKYEKQTGNKPFIGIVGGDSIIRDQNYLKTGCNAFDSKRPKSTPLAFWNEEDIWDYIKIFNVPYSKIYDMGYTRTGCIFCVFGCHLEKGENRFQLMQRTHPKLHNYCMKDWTRGGLGLSIVLDYIKVPWENNIRQITFDDL